MIAVTVVVGIGRVESQMLARRAKDREGHNHNADECGEDEDDLRTMATQALPWRCQRH